MFSLYKFLPDLLADHPGLNINLHHALSRQVTEQVISHNLDFGIVVNPVSHPDLVIKPLATDKVTFYSLKKPSKNQNWKTGTAVLICDADLNQTQALLRQAARKKMAFSRTVTSSNLEVIYSLTVNGAGIGVLPGQVVKNAFFAGSLKIKLVAIDGAPVFNDKICLVYRQDMQQSQASKVIAGAIAASF